MSLARRPPLVLAALTYPVVMSLAVGAFWALRGQGFALVPASYAPVVGGALVITALEQLWPYRPAWRPNPTEVRQDATFLLVVQMLLPKLLGLAAAMGLAKLRHGAPPSELWPHAWSTPLQALLMLLLADLLRYWLHRWAHNAPLLWRLHAVHHSPARLYWLNVGRFHPADKGLQYLADALPFIALGVSGEVLALYFVFYAVNGFFQHCNIAVRLGPLNHLISGPELHRWHHSRVIEESNNNYGNNLILWDTVFGSRYLPGNREVGDLGLLNPDYPTGFASQLAAPLSDVDKRSQPPVSLRAATLNRLMALRMRAARKSLWRPLVHAAERPGPTQEAVLLRLLRHNENTEFGRAHGFEALTTVAAFRAAVPVQDYESLRPWVERQEREGAPALTADQPVMYNQTSGSTGQPKYIPVLRQTLQALRRDQRLSALLQYERCPEAFSGKLLGLVSPAIEGRLPSGLPFGSASGHIYKSMPRLAQAKYVLPAEVFEIKDHELRYYVIARLAAAHEDITYMGAANPSSFHKLLAVLNSRLGDIARDIAHGDCQGQAKLPADTRAALAPHFKARPRRAATLQRLAAQGKPVSFAAIWPWVRLLATWTGGSCGIALRGLLPEFPEGLRVVDIGYLASELRATVTVNADTQDGLPTLQDTFFEFVEKHAWQRGEPTFLGLADLQLGQEYYLFVTTAAGLYRYDMNDIVRVTGHLRATPLLRFLQKGRGVTNITGEKLYESQLLDAIDGACIATGLCVRFWQALAHEAAGHYELYIEAEQALDRGALASVVERSLCEQNIEYASKLASGRLLPLKIHRLKAGTFEAYKAHYLALGQREGQFKPAVLQYKKDLTFPITDWTSS